MKTQCRFITAAVCGLLTALLVVLVLFADTAPIGPAGTSVGLSHLNRFVFDLFGVHILWYHVTDWLGVAAVLTAFVFAVSGLVQLAGRKSIRKVDPEILLLGGLYLVVIGLYVLFECKVVNYRPVIMPGAMRPEASFPSSHTMIVCVIMGSTALLAGRYVRKRALRTALRVFCAVVAAITVGGRLVSGVHWFTDILGGLLISVTLLELYAGCLPMVQKASPAHSGLRESRQGAQTRRAGR